MKVKYLKLIAIFGLSNLIITPSIANTILDEVVATVNNQPILNSEVTNALRGSKDIPQNRKLALDTLINNMLLDQVAQNVGGSQISQQDIENVIASFLYDNDITYGEFLDMLDDTGVSLDEYKNSIMKQMSMGGVMQALVQANTNIEPEQIQKLAERLELQDKEQGKFKPSEAKQYHARHILIKTNPIVTHNVAKDQLQQIRKNILDGASTFEDEAKQHSMDYLSGSKGGDLGWAFPDTYEPTFSSQLTTTKVGSISQPFQSAFGWHIIQLLETKIEDNTKEQYFRKAQEKFYTFKQLEMDSSIYNILRAQAQIEYK